MMHTVIADDRRRVTLPDIQPGQRFDVSRDAQGRIILRELKPVPRDLENVPVLKLSKSGKLIWPGGVTKPTAEQIARAVREERDNR